MSTFKPLGAKFLHPKLLQPKFLQPKFFHPKFLGALAVLSGLSATPVLAQAVVQEPGYCAFFYPNANCQNKGPGNPYGNYPQPSAYGNDWSRGEALGVAPKRPRTHRHSATAKRM
jgi:hypothetical protein